MKKYFAEFIGTFVLTFLGCGTAMFLGCNTPAGVVGTAIADNSAEARVSSRMFELTYASAEEVAENFNRTWRGRVVTNGVPFLGDMAVPFIEANSVMVTAPESILDNCAAMVAKIDRKPRQVYVEARFVELKNRAAYDLGIDCIRNEG